MAWLRCWASPPSKCWLQTGSTSALSHRSRSLPSSSESPSASPSSSANPHHSPLITHNSRRPTLLKRLALPLSSHALSSGLVPTHRATAAILNPMPSPPQIVTVTAASATYDIHIGTGLLANLAGHIAALSNKPNARLIVVTSPEIWTLHGAAL